MDQQQEAARLRQRPPRAFHLGMVLRLDHDLLRCKASRPKHAKRLHPQRHDPAVLTRVAQQDGADAARASYAQAFIGDRLQHPQKRPGPEVRQVDGLIAAGGLARFEPVTRTGAVIGDAAPALAPELGDELSSGVELLAFVPAVIDQ